MITGDDVRHARGRLRLTQMQLAELVGMSRRTIAEWETMDVLPATAEGRLSAVFAGNSSQQGTDGQPLSEVSDLELVAELARRLASLRAVQPGALAARPGDPGPVDSTKPAVFGVDRSQDPDGSGEVGTSDVDPDGDRGNSGSYPAS